MNREYKNLARFYDPATAWFMRGIRRRIVCRALEAVPENQSIRSAAATARVLDLGCGTGQQLLALRSAGLCCAGVDNSPEMLAVAARRLGPEKSKQDCPLLLAEADKLPFKNDSFDLVLLCLVLHESESDPLEILRSAARVSPRILVLEWKMAERNLDYPLSLPVQLIERLAGRRHYQSFRRFMRQGGLEGLIQRFNLEADKKNFRRLEPVRLAFPRLGTMFLLELRRQ